MFMLPVDGRRGVLVNAPHPSQVNAAHATRKPSWTFNMFASSLLLLVVGYRDAYLVARSFKHAAVLLSGSDTVCVKKGLVSCG